MNPILPLQHHVPDVEARVWKDGRIYLYGSYDIPGDTAYCSYEYRVFSSGDLVNWTDHGVSFTSGGPGTGVPWSRGRLYAPDCIYKDGKYYLFFCTSDNGEGVAVSDKPYGPFRDAVPVEGAHGDAIDPAVFIDDDGQTYYYWGQFHCRGARLQPDMKGIDPDTLNRSLIDEANHGFHEGASMRKRNGIYYLVYTDISRGKATCISYAMSQSPLGPFEKGGVIIDNDGCDPDTWNNHGSIAEFNGQWYVFYHRSSKNSKFSRHVCVEPIFFDEDGRIKEVEMTTQGASGPIPATRRIEAWRACRLSGSVRTEQVEPADENGTWSEHLSHISNGDWAAYKYVDFGKGVTGFAVRAASLAYGGTVEVRIDEPDGPLIASCEVRHTGGWRRWAEVFSPIAPGAVSGVHAVYLVFRGDSGRLMSVESFRFIG